MAFASNPQAIAAILDVIYPVGSIIEWVPVSGSSVDLSTAEKVGACYGGTWEAYGTNQFLLGASPENVVGSYGGEAQVSLTAAQNGQHDHSVYTEFGAAGDVNFHPSYLSGSYVQLSGMAGAHAPLNGFILSSGNGEPHNNMPPYITVYRWRRIA